MESWTDFLFARRVSPTSLAPNLRLTLEMRDSQPLVGEHVNDEARPLVLNRLTGGKPFESGVSDPVRVVVCHDNVGPAQEQLTGTITSLRVIKVADWEMLLSWAMREESEPRRDAMAEALLYGGCARKMMYV
ncbi:hypothetical protein V2J09_016625 [Rumex salicifolius]